MTSYAILPMAAFAVNLMVWSYVFGQRKADPANRAFLLFSASAGGWLFTHLMLYVPDVVGWESVVFIVQSIFWIPIGLLFLNFAYALVGRPRDRFFKVLTAATIICNIAYFNIDLFVDGYKQFDWGIIQIYRGLPHTIVSGIAAVSAASGLYLIAHQRRRATHINEKKTLNLILLGGVITLLATLAVNVALPVYFGLMNSPRYGSSALVVFITIVFLAVNKYQFLSISVESVANELFDDINDGVLLVGAGGLIERENNAIKEMLRSSSIGKPASDLLPGIDLTADIVNRQVEVDTPDGKSILAVSSSTPATSSRRRGRIIIVRDVTEQKLAEDVLRRSRDDLEKEVEKRTAELRHAQRMEAIGTFTGAIAHDFNNLLAAILGFTYAARRELPTSSAAHDDLAEVVLAGRRAREIIRQLLTFSRRDEKLEYQPVRLSTVAKEAVDLLRVSLPSTISTHFDIENVDGTVHCDPLQITQVIMNLSTNAFHAMKDQQQGEFRLVLENVTVESTLPKSIPPLEPGQYARIVVSDTGVGMDRDTVERMFDPFFTTKPPGEGTGLGLSTSLGIIRNHNGAIEVDSETGRGTTFTVYLPLIDMRPISRLPGEEAPHAKGDEHILVVDDESQVARLMVRLLKPLGYQVTTRPNGREALTAVTNAPEDFDMVLTDYTMPELTGVQLAEQLLRIFPAMPIVLMSGYGEELSRKEIQSIGIKAVLKKPIPVEELASTIRAVLDDTSKRSN